MPHIVARWSLNSNTGQSKIRYRHILLTPRSGLSICTQVSLQNLEPPFCWSQLQAVWNYREVYSETPDKGHSKRGQTSQKRTSQKHLILYAHFIEISPLKEDNLSTKDNKTAGPESVFIKRFHCTIHNCSDFNVSMRIYSDRFLALW